LSKASVRVGEIALTALLFGYGVQPVCRSPSTVFAGVLSVFERLSSAPTTKFAPI
jgi:hypothetical protein